MVIQRKVILFDEEKRAINYWETEGFNPGEKRYTIEEFYIDHGIKQMYKLHCGDNYSFEGWFNADIKTKQSMDSLSFDLDSDHPLYLPFLHMLKDDKRLIINDEYTPNENSKYAEIRKEEDRIILSFTNNLNPEDVTKKFLIHKGLMYDGKDEEIKRRIKDFFEEATKAMNQISKEEFVVRDKGPNSEEAKQLIKTVMPNSTEAA